MAEDRTIEIEHFADVLCIWAYIGEIRLAQVRAEFGAQVRFTHRFCSVFGDSARRIESRWGDKGGVAGFAAHVHEVAADFDHVQVHPDIWQTVRPASSASSHLFLHAVAVANADAAGGQDRPAPGCLKCSGSETLCESALECAASALRHAFFRDNRDVSTWAVQAEVTEELGLDVESMRAALNSGAAHARLAGDYEDVARLHIQGSPTLVLDGGRERLYGNVGFRVIEANIQELLRAPDRSHASWC